MQFRVSFDTYLEPEILVKSDNQTSNAKLTIKVFYGPELEVLVEPLSLSEKTFLQSPEFEEPLTGTSGYLTMELILKKLLSMPTMKFQRQTTLDGICIHQESEFM